MKKYKDILGDGGSNIIGQVEAQQARLGARLSRIRRTVAVVSGKGGVGKSVVTVNLAFKSSDVGHPLDAVGFVVPRTENRSLVACTFASRKFPGRSPEGTALLRAFVGGAFGRHFLHLPDDELVSTVLKDLSGLLGLKGKPLFWSLQRYPDSMVQYAPGHQGLVRRMEEDAQRHAGLFLTGASYRGVGIPDCVEDAEKQAEKIFEYLSTSC